MPHVAELDPDQFAKAMYDTLGSSVKYCQQIDGIVKGMARSILQTEFYASYVHACVFGRALPRGAGYGFTYHDHDSVCHMAESAQCDIAADNLLGSFVRDGQF